MKDLRVLKRLLISFLSVSLALFASSDATKYLSPEKQETLKLDQEINNKSATSLKYDWIEPIVASYSHSKNDQLGQYSTSKYFAVTFDQPVFKSGGIYFAIQYANANRAFLDLSLKLQEATLIQTLYNSVLGLQKIDLQLKRLDFLIANAQIDIERKREQFDSGLLDSSFLDSAILNKTTLEHQKLDLENNRYTLLTTFKDISSAAYEEVILPSFHLVSQQEFIENNLEIAQKNEQSDQARELKNMTISNYLPTVSLYGSYNHKDEELRFFNSATEYRNFGAKVSMPIFAINRGRDIEIKKLEFLKAKIATKEQSRTARHAYERVTNEIDLLQKRIEIANKDVALYDSLLINAEEGLMAGEKTQMDVDTLENSKSIAALDAKIYDLDIQLSLLNLYAKMSDAL